MSRRILIDSEYPEEIRVVLCNDNKIEQFEYQNGLKRSLKGNVYLAKVTRVEPSLQAAFVDFGEERKGFLSFEEIHPDYYQIPSADKEKLLKLIKDAKDKDLADLEDNDEGKKGEATHDEEKSVTNLELCKQYKIQEVIKRDQIILVQVDKEERGNKGASLTTYISLPGRYCVFMPNANKNGGISRKVQDPQERKRLKSIISEIYQDGNASSVIIRTAGTYKTKTEIKKDFEYLSKLWSDIKEQTIASIAPSFIYEEGDIVKKSIRDFYDSEVEEVIISGKELYNKAKKFMSMLLQRNVNKVKLYKENLPIFTKYGVEQEINKLYNNKVMLESGGYIIINQTEALVAIDVNSGKYTGEYNIEGTALKINMEAAKEIAKQLKLRDLSGLIVIDFIDMYEVQNRISVEKELREMLNDDKAKVHMSRISEFGLLEMSRQRTGQSFVELHSSTCPYCNGVGKIKSISLVVLNVLREINKRIQSKKNITDIIVCSVSELVLYILNNKKELIANLEKEYSIKIEFHIDESMQPDSFKIDTIEKSRKTNRSYNADRLKQNTRNKESGQNIDSNSKYFKLANKRQIIRRYDKNDVKNKHIDKSLKSFDGNTTRKKTRPTLFAKVWKNLLSKNNQSKK